MWWVFNYPIRHIQSVDVVIDELGPHFVDKEYVKEGIREGWLKRTGYYRDNHNRLVWTYSHITRP
jgi:hypothetical protein